MIWIYNGAPSDPVTLIMLKNASASSSASLNSSGSTTTPFPSGAYTMRIVFSDERDTNTRTGGVRTPWKVGTPTHAASHGRDAGPPSPKCRTSPQSGFVSPPMGVQDGINIFSSRTDTVCDLPEPCTPHTIAEKGAFWMDLSKTAQERNGVLTVLTYMRESSSGVSVSAPELRAALVNIARVRRDQVTHQISKTLPSTPYCVVCPAEPNATYASLVKMGAVRSSWSLLRPRVFNESSSRSCTSSCKTLSQWPK